MIEFSSSLRMLATAKCRHRKWNFFCRRGCGSLQCWQTRGLRSFLWIIHVSVEKPRISFDFVATFDTRKSCLWTLGGSSFGIYFLKRSQTRRWLCSPFVSTFDRSALFCTPRERPGTHGKRNRKFWALLLTFSTRHSTLGVQSSISCATLLMTTISRRKFRFCLLLGATSMTISESHVNLPLVTCFDKPR